MQATATTDPKYTSTRYNKHVICGELELLFFYRSARKFRKKKKKNYIIFAFRSFRALRHKAVHSKHLTGSSERQNGIGIDSGEGVCIGASERTETIAATG